MSRKLKVCLFGSRASGKTTFLAGLEALNVPSQPSRLSVHSASPEVRERLKGLARALRAGAWPPSTTRLEQYDLVVKVDAAGGGGTSLVDLHVLDYDGELARQLDAAGREELEELRRHVATADVILLLLDPEQDVRPPDGASPEARQTQAERQAALLGAVDEAWRHCNPDDRRPLPMSDVVVVLTKVDTVPELTDRGTARTYVELHLPALLPKVAERVGGRPADVGVFPLSAVGSVETLGGRPAPKPPLAPRGYDELFDFIIALRMRRVWDRRRKVAATAAACVALIAGGWTAYRAHAANQERAEITNPGLPADVRIDKGRRSGDPALQQLAVALAEDEVQRLRSEIAAAGSLAGLAEVADRVKKIQRVVPEQFASDANRLTGQVRDRRRQVWFATIEQKHKNDAQDPSLLKGMNDFLAEFLDGREATAVRGWRDEYHEVQWQRAKAAVKLLPANDAPTLAAKADALERYVDRWKARHPDVAEVARMGRAVALARQFAARRDYPAKLRESGEFTERRWPIIAVHHAGGTWQASETASRSTVKRWDEPLTVSWQAGESLRVEFWVYHGSYPFGAEKLAASWAGRGPLQLLDLDGTLELTPAPDWRDSFVGGPKVTFSLGGVDAGDANCLREFLAPGDKW